MSDRGITRRGALALAAGTILSGSLSYVSLRPAQALASGHFDGVKFLVHEQGHHVCLEIDGHCLPHHRACRVPGGFATHLLPYETFSTATKMAHAVIASGRSGVIALPTG
jgi:hypothetical protein